MANCIRVEVSDVDGQIVAIEPEMLAGRDIGDSEEETIRWAIRQLNGFLGNADLIAAAEAVTCFDWSDNDADAVRAIERLRSVVAKATV